MIRVQLLKSGIGYDKTQKDTLIGLGLRKRHKIVELKDTPQIRGMVYKVRHLVKVLGEKELVAKPSPWKGVVITPGPKTDTGPASAKKEAKAGKKAGTGKGAKKAATSKKDK